MSSWLRRLGAMRKQRSGVRICILGVPFNATLCQLP